jgi:uncharacterized repeat protein (TIGR03809 family)
MAESSHDARGLAGRWQALAEARLDHLTSLFETGRWHRFYSQAAFTENLREAEAAVETWRRLGGGEPAPVKPAIAAALPDGPRNKPDPLLPEVRLDVPADPTRANAPNPGSPHRQRAAAQQGQGNERQPGAVAGTPIPFAAF